MRPASKRKDHLTLKYGKSEEVGPDFGLSQLVKITNHENAPDRCCPKEMRGFPLIDLQTQREEDGLIQKLKPRWRKGFSEGD